MPSLGLPLILSKFTPQIMVTLFVRANASNEDILFIRDSVTIARTIMAKSGIGVAVIPPRGMNSNEEIGTFSYTGPLFQDVTNSYGRPQTISPGGETARTEVAGKMTASKTAVVLFGGSSSSRARGNTKESTNFPWFCMVDIAASVKTTMLHEVGHCANLQHYMAYRDVLKSSTQDDKNIMAEVPDPKKADLRGGLTTTELDLFRKCDFFGLLD